jgi:hypothetical protein
LGAWKGITKERENNQKQNTKSNLNESQGYGGLVNQGVVSRIA